MIGSKVLSSFMNSIPAIGKAIQIHVLCDIVLSKVKSKSTEINKKRRKINIKQGKHYL